MITLDVNEQHGLALVDIGMEEGQKESRYKIVALKDAPPLPAKPTMARVYLRQVHYVVSHAPVGLMVVDLPVPKDGWKYRT